MKSENTITSLVAVVVVTIVLLSIGWWGACTFMVGPKFFDAYIESEGKFLATEPEVCKDVDSRALASLSGLLATLMAMRRTT